MAIEKGGAKPPDDTKIHLIKYLIEFEKLYQNIDKKLFNSQLAIYREEHQKLMENRYYESKVTYDIEFNRLLLIIRLIFALGYTKFKYFDENILNEYLKCSLKLFILILSNAPYFNKTDSLIKATMLDARRYRMKNYFKFMEKIEELDDNDYQRISDCTNIRNKGLFNEIQMMEEEFNEDNMDMSDGGSKKKGGRRKLKSYK
jgi:hypothetical protein